MALAVPASWIPAGVPDKWVPIHRLSGWKQVGGHIGQIEANMPPNHFILAGDRMLTAHLAFYVPSQGRVYQTQPGTRVESQYHIWPGYQGLLHYDAIVVVEGKGSRPTVLPGEVRGAFAGIEAETFTATDSSGRAIRTYGIWLCHDFRGRPHGRPATDPAPND